YVVPAMENVALWHERDISHSSVERMIGPDATVTLDFALMRAAGMMAKLTVYPERMQANLESLGGVGHSQKVLLALTQAGLAREAAYAAVQRGAMATWQALGTEGARDFAANLLADPEVASRFDTAALAAVMDPARDFGQVDAIFDRVLGAG
ncbi:MAG: adenylosuccinate lyase, partial [Roseomonas sp.]|nr:adenylosuccinate lyase [Roseomonas sp.]